MGQGPFACYGRPRNRQLSQIGGAGQKSWWRKGALARRGTNEIAYTELWAARSCYTACKGSVWDNVRVDEPCGFPVRTTATVRAVDGQMV